MVTDAAEPFFALDAVELDVGFGSPRRQQRLLVAFRGLLVLPQLLAVAVLGLLATVLMVVGWFAALVLGRLPRWIAAFEMRWIAYSIRVNVYGFMLLDEYPPFSLTETDYPVAVKIGASRLSRLKVLFRWLLGIPAYIVSGVAANGLLVFSPILWIVTLVLGRMPRPLFGAAAAVIRYQARFYAYVGLVSDFYPRRLFGDSESVPAPEGPGRELRLPLSEGAKHLLRLIIVLGVAAGIGNIILRIELRPSPPSPALVAAEARFERASLTFVTTVARCGTGSKAFRCARPPERAWSAAFDRFGSRLSRISFSGSKRGLAAATAHDARTIAQALANASRARTAARYTRAWARVQALVRRFEAASKRLLGHPL